MKLQVQIIDNRNTRSGNLARRVMSFLQSNQSDPRLKDLNYNVGRFVSGTESGVGLLATPVDRTLSLIHYDDDEIISLLKKLAADANARPAETHQAVVYSGNAFTTTMREMMRDAAGKLLDLIVCEERVEGAEIGDRAGLEQLPVEHYLVKLLGLPDNVVVIPSVLDSSGIHHKLINACSALRANIDLSKSRNVIDSGLKKVLDDSKNAFARISESVPLRYRAAWERAESWLSDLDEDIETRNKRLIAASLEISDIENYARTLRNPTDYSELSNLTTTSACGRRLKVLWIEDEPQWYNSFKSVLNDCFIDVEFCGSMTKWIAQLNHLDEFDAVLLDIALQGQRHEITVKMSKHDLIPKPAITDDNAGIGVLQLLRSNAACPPVFMLTAWKSLDAIQACTRFGARRYFVKGENDIIDLVTAIQNKAEVGMRDERRRDAKIPRNPKLLIGGSSDPFVHIITQIEKVARSKSRGPVYLCGAPGIGKSAIAEELQIRSGRPRERFIKKNCASFGDLADSQLFGHKKGDFTGATADKIGCLKQADGGILFLDEIDKLDRKVQEKLLTFFDDRYVKPIGKETDGNVDVLIVVASNANLKDVSAKGGFCQPFYDRISRIPILIPTLQERAIFVPSLFRQMLNRAATNDEGAEVVLAPNAITWVENNARTGAFTKNVRDLEHIIERLLIFDDGQLSIDAAVIEKAFVMGDRTMPPEAASQYQKAAEALAAVTDCNPVHHSILLDHTKGSLIQVLLSRHSKGEVARRLMITVRNLDQFRKTLRDKGLLHETEGDV